MAGGQFIDMTGSANTQADGVHMHRLKTGALIEASVGAVVALAKPHCELAEGLMTYAAELGLMFQIVDDLLDVTGVTEKTGKTPGSDKRNGPRTTATDGVEHANLLADSCLDGSPLNSLRCP